MSMSARTHGSRFRCLRDHATSESQLFHKMSSGRQALLPSLSAPSLSGFWVAVLISAYRSISSTGQHCDAQNWL